MTRPWTRSGTPSRRLDALLAQDRVEDVGVVDVVDRDRALLGGDAAGEAAAERDLDALLDLLLDALGRAGVQPVALEQQDRHGVDLEDLATRSSSSSRSSSSGR
jgi:hypothetical protein